MDAAADVVEHPFRAAAVELYGVLFDSFGDVDITDEFSLGNSHAFFWRAVIGDRTIEGADLVAMNDEGKVAEIRVLIRPLVDIGAFAGAAGPQLAAKRGRMRAWLLRLMTPPLRGILVLADKVAARLVQR